ncbi:MAG: Polymer-forming cytoskeletal protein [Lachnoclostridium sp.]
MGFFKDFKDDLSQAVNELIPEEVFDDSKEVNTLEGNDTKETAASEEVTNNDEDDNVDMEILDAILTKDEEEDNKAEEKVTEPDMDSDAEEPKEDEFKEEESVIEASAEEVSAEDALTDEVSTDEIPSEDEENSESDEVTVITKGTVINGNIIAQGSLEVMGTIKGDIDCQGKLSVIGLVTGNCLASEVYIGSKRFEGSITSEGSVKIGLGTVVIGDISGTSAVIAGAVKGDIDISGPVIVDSSAVVKGNIKAQSIQINNGAVVDGYCSLPYASVNIDNIFE